MDNNAMKTQDDVKFFVTPHQLIVACMFNALQDISVIGITVYAETIKILRLKIVVMFIVHKELVATQIQVEI